MIYADFSHTVNLAQKQNAARIIQERARLRAIMRYKEEELDIPDEQVKVWVARSQPRNKVTGAIAFDISFEYAGWKTHRVSILDLMDLEDNSFPYDEVTNAVNDYIAKAKLFPRTKRNCLCCSKKAATANVLCLRCIPKFSKVIYAE